MLGSIVVVCEIYNLYFEVWAWFEWDLTSSWVPNTHRIFSHSLFDRGEPTTTLNMIFSVRYTKYERIY